MARRKSLVELKKMVELELQYSRDFVGDYKEERNPQIVEMVQFHEGKIDALEAILEYTKTGSGMYFASEEANKMSRTR